MRRSNTIGFAGLLAAVAVVVATAAHGAQRHRALLAAEAQPPGVEQTLALVYAGNAMP